ncbi:class I SAM-dependent methyltransferase [Kosakonia cowanii]|uniref:class I SAM-dependent methyltransferase n=1 Tax=Kosakonia cowanii TaxID=208223 RepID=UPI00034752A4
MSNKAAEGILALYQRHAAAFAEQRSRALFEKTWLEKFAARLPPQGQIVDIGCGNGQPIAGWLIAQGFQVTGVDGAPAMIDRARENFPQQRWLLQDMRQLSLGETFDGLIAWDSFFHLTQDDQKQMFARFEQHSHAGSVLMFTSGPEEGEAFGQMEGETLYHASLAPQTYRALLAEINFEVVDVVLNDPHCTGHSVWLAQRKA